MPELVMLEIFRLALPQIIARVALLVGVPVLLWWAR